jgi:hypothetical protein
VTRYGAEATGDAPPPDPTRVQPVRPPRPITVEASAALMVVSGALATITTVEAWLALDASGGTSGGLLLLSLAIGIGMTALGVLVRFGRAWLVAVNVMAIAGFLELTSGSVQGWLFGGMDVAVVVMLLRDRPWFHWRDALARDDADGDA